MLRRPLLKSILFGISLFSMIPGWSIGNPLSVAQAAPAPRQQLAMSPQMTKEQAIQKLALDLVNRDRAAAGLPPVQVDPLLSKVAQDHANDMLSQKYFSHYSSNGKSPEDRLAAAGGTGNPSENIVMRYNTRFNYINIQQLEEFQAQWMNSTLHHRNLMNPKHQKFGYGLAIDRSSGKTFAVQLFNDR